MEYVLFDNSLKQWATAAAIAMAVYFASRLAKAIALSQLKKRAESAESPWNGIPAKAFERLHSLFFLIAAIYCGSLLLSLPEKAAHVVAKAFILGLLLQIGLLASQIISASFETYRRKKIEKNADTVTMLSSVSFLSRVALWVFLLLLALDNFGINITALVAGLGVGGVAVALAVQNILGDVFASFSIVLDKPFVIGDFIIVDDHLGTVEHVGLKTTRVRSLSGEQLIFSNEDLLKSRIRNFKRMFERRVVFNIGIRYETPIDKIRAVPTMIKEIVQGQSPVRFDRAHFKEYGPYSLNFEIVYWILDPDYNVYMDIQQAINIGIYDRFAAEGIGFAYPTQTLLLPHHIKGDPSTASTSSVDHA